MNISKTPFGTSRVALVLITAGAIGLMGVLASPVAASSSSAPPVAGTAARVSSPTPPTASGFLPGWGLPAWRDEFDFKNSADQPAIDPSKWNVRSRSDLGLLFDAAIPDPSQVSVDGSGVAHLKGDWLPEPVPRPSGQSGPVLTHKTGYMDQRFLKPGNVSWGQRYGRWEIRAKVPTRIGDTYGALAAFWLRGNRPGEIDIMEAWGSGPTPRAGQRPGTSTTTIFSNTSTAADKKFWPIEPTLGITEPNWMSFHVWALEYTPTKFSMLYDGQRVFTTTPAESPILWNPEYFDGPLHVRLNLHVGPSEAYWGIPKQSERGITGPLDFQVDYVRIYPFGAVPPAPPTATVSATTANSVSLSWSPDSSQPIQSTRISRNGVALAEVAGSQLSFVDNSLTPGTAYQYSLVAEGVNGLISSASVITATTTAAPRPVDFIPTGSSWRWQYLNASWPTGWNSINYNDSRWPIAPAVLGFGATSIAKNIDVSPPASKRPLSAQFRKAFDIADPKKVSAVSITTRADDGVVVYVNGVEVGRSGMPTGILHSASYATAAPRTDRAVASPVSIAVPAALLVAGKNVISASVHLNYHATPDLSFDLKMDGLQSP